MVFERGVFCTETFSSRWLDSLLDSLQARAAVSRGFHTARSRCHVSERDFGNQSSRDPLDTNVREYILCRWVAGYPSSTYKVTDRRSGVTRADSEPLSLSLSQRSSVGVDDEARLSTYRVGAHDTSLKGGSPRALLLDDRSRGERERERERETLLENSALGCLLEGKERSGTQLNTQVLLAARGRGARRAQRLEVSVGV